MTASTFNDRSTSDVSTRDHDDKPSLKDVRDDLAAVKRDLSALGADTAQYARGAVQSAGNATAHAGRDIAERGREAHGAVCDFTRRNPTAAVLLAFGVGAIVARVLPHR